MATNGAASGSGNPSPAFDGSSTVPLWINGKERTLTETFDVTSPLDHKTLYKASSASTNEVDEAVAAAAEAFKSWSQTKPSQRRDIFLRAAEIFQQRKGELWHYENTETGAPQPYFDFDFNGAVEGCKATAGLITAAACGSVPTLSGEGRSAMVLKEPYGVVLGIAPWNAPYILGQRAFLQPIAMGNTVVLKGPEASPATYWALASIFHEAGLPAGVLNTIYHSPANASEVTTALVSSPMIKKINFTGSTNVGAIIASLAGKHLKPTVMELGGKAPSIVCEDADIQNAAVQCALGALMHAGQICMSTERILVHEKIADEFKKALAGATGQIFGQASTMASPLGVEKTKKLLDDAISKGAETIYGDASLNEANKHQMKPVIIGGVNPKMDIYYTESFGPTVSVYTYTDDEEAIRIANDTEYGLASAVFSQDLRRALKIAKRIETGAVHINQMSVHDEPALPHGGAKKSGFGRFSTLDGLNEWVRTKNITWMD